MLIPFNSAPAISESRQARHRKPEPALPAVERTGATSIAKRCFGPIITFDKFP
jgi:hypothetical protein